MDHFAGLDVSVNETSVDPRPRSFFDARAPAKDRIWSNPTVDPAAVVANLETAIRNCLDEMQVLGTPNLTQNDISDFELWRR